MKLNDLTGKTFERLTVVSPAQSVKTKTGSYKMWNCSCVCGATTRVRSQHLTGGLIRSCGCFQKERTAAMGRATRKTNGEAYLRYVYGYYERNAAKRGYAFNLSFESFCKRIQANCFYCGAAPSQGKNKSRLNRPEVFFGITKHNGLDRVDNNLGYDESNIVACCADCNRAKRTRTNEEFKAWVKRLYEHLYLKK